MTRFDTIKLSGTFSCNNVQCRFIRKGSILEFVNADIRALIFCGVFNGIRSRRLES